MFVKVSLDILFTFDFSQMEVSEPAHIISFAIVVLDSCVAKCLLIVIMEGRLSTILSLAPAGHLLIHKVTKASFPLFSFVSLNSQSPNSRFAERATATFTSIFHASHLPSIE